MKSLIETLFDFVIVAAGLGIGMVLIWASDVDTYVPPPLIVRMKSPIETLFDFIAAGLGIGMVLTSGSDVDTDVPL